MPVNSLQSISSPWMLIKLFNRCQRFMTKCDYEEGLPLRNVLKHPDCDVADVYEMQVFLSKYVGLMALHIAQDGFRKQYKKTQASSDKALLALKNLTTLSLKS